MNLEAIKVFCDVVRQKSFSRAATANGVTQSAVSQTVSQLEKTLGAQLIDRSKRPIELTTEGQVYFEGCKELIDRYKALLSQVQSLGNEITGTVSVAAIYSVGLGDMSWYVQQFSRIYPKAAVRLAYLHPDRVYEQVLNGEVDLGLVSYPKERPGLTVQAWRQDPMMVVCPRKHPLAKRRVLTARDLDGEDFVAFDESLSIRKEIDRELNKRKAKVRIVMAFDNIETIKRAVEIGEGISILPDRTVRAEIQAGTISIVPLTAPALSRPLGIIYRHSGGLSPTAKCFVELIQESTGGSAGDGARDDLGSSTHT